MQMTNEPYPVPRKLESGLAPVLAFWQGLRRREAEIPFWDDIDISALPDVSGRLMLLEASDQPVRFRCGFGVVGEEIKRQYGGDLASKFLDEIEVRHPLQFLISQSSATIESRRPTYYRHALAKKGGSSHVEREYARLVLPMWGNGHIGMLLVAFAWG